MATQRLNHDRAPSNASSEKTAPVNHDDYASQNTHVRNEKGTVPANDSLPAPDFSHIDEKKVLRKMDMRLIPMLALLYLLSFLDRGNIGNAKIEGMVEDLGMTGPQYNWCLTVFFFTYCAFEVPSNLLYELVLWRV